MSAEGVFDFFSGAVQSIGSAATESYIQRHFPERENPVNPNVATSVDPATDRAAVIQQETEESQTNMMLIGGAALLVVVLIVSMSRR